MKFLLNILVVFTVLGCSSSKDVPGVLDEPDKQCGEISSSSAVLPTCLPTPDVKSLPNKFGESGELCADFSGNWEYGCSISGEETQGEVFIEQESCVAWNLTDESNDGIVIHERIGSQGDVANCQDEFCFDRKWADSKVGVEYNMVSNEVEIDGVSVDGRLVISEKFEYVVDESAFVKRSEFNFQIVGREDMKSYEECTYRRK